MGSGGWRRNDAVHIPTFIRVSHIAFLDKVHTWLAVKFSAQAFDYYCEASGLQVHRFLQTAQ